MDLTRDPRSENLVRKKKLTSQMRTVKKLDQRTEPYVDQERIILWTDADLAVYGSLTKRPKLWKSGQKMDLNPGNS